VALDIEVASSGGIEKRLEDEGDGYTSAFEAEDGFDE